jgi:hypothetical protein
VLPVTSEGIHDVKPLLGVDPAVGVPARLGRPSGPSLRLSLMSTCYRAAMAPISSTAIVLARVLRKLGAKCEHQDTGQSLGCGSSMRVGAPTGTINVTMVSAVTPPS